MWPFRKRSEERSYWGIQGVQDLLPADTVGRGNAVPPVVSNDKALRHSAVWAAVRLRADLISTLPLDVYRHDNGIQVPAPATPVLLNPGGDRVDLVEWLYSSQVELDRSGNSIGIIRDVDRSGYPTRIDLQPTSVCSVLVSNDNELTGYRIRGKTYSLDEIWHEKQYTVSGLHVGLSPVAYAAYQLGEYQSVLDFARTWFAGSAVPRVSLKNTEKKLNGTESLLVKESWRATQSMDEPFVHGSNWELKFLNAEQRADDFVNLRKFSVTELARFFGCPADLIDGAVSGESVTYANITSRQLAFLVMNLGPAIIRRERALSKLLPRPRFVKLNSDAILRMDPKTRSEMIDTQLRNHTVTVTEARALDNRAPLTDTQMAEVLTHFPPKASAAGATNAAL
jgi:HK97 family phage portal protein